MNNNITEDYCSFEVSKLLKEKGFAVSGYLNEVWLGNSYKGKVCTAVMGLGVSSKLPTHALAIKWIRENFGIHIKIDWFTKDDNSIDWDYSIQKIGTDIDERGDSDYLRDYDPEVGFNSHEEAESAALLYTLKHLI